MFERKMVLSIGFTLLLLLNHGEGQSCPEIPNVANVCESVSYTGARVLLDTSTFTEAIQNCSCTFSTTADMIRIVTYAAPNYQQCNSAIRLYSSSGNAMRFQCLMSGTYLDTTAHKTGGADFETFGPIYDKNYCLVLEHLGSEADTITISCNGTDQNAATTTDIQTANSDITDTSVDAATFTSTTTATTTMLAAESTSSTSDNTPSTPGSIVITTSIREAFTTPSLSSSNETLLAVNETVSLISDLRFSTNGTPINETNKSIFSDNQDQHTSEISDSFSSSHVLLMPNNIAEEKNETVGENSTTLFNETSNMLNSMDTIVFGATDEDVLSNSLIVNQSKLFGNDAIATGNITFDSNILSGNSQEDIYSTVQTKTVRPDLAESLNNSTDNELTVPPQILKSEDTAITPSPESRSSFGNNAIAQEIGTKSPSHTENLTFGTEETHKDTISTKTPTLNKDPIQIKINNTETNNTGMNDTFRLGDWERNVIDTMSNQTTITTLSPLSRLDGTFGNDAIQKTTLEIDENTTTSFGNDSLSVISFGIDALFSNTSVHENDKEITSNITNDSTEKNINTSIRQNLPEINPIMDISGLENSIWPNSTKNEERATIGSNAIQTEAVTSNVVTERPISRDDNVTMLVSAENEHLINNITTNDGFHDTIADNQSMPELIIHNRSTFRPDYIPTESSTFGIDLLAGSKTTKTPSVVQNSNNKVIDGSVVESKTININADLGVETTTDNSISLLSDLMRESALLDSLVKDSNSDDNNDTMSMTNIDGTTFRPNAVGVENEPMKSSRPDIMGSGHTLNNDTILKIINTQVVSQKDTKTVIRKGDRFDLQPSEREIFGLDVLPSNDSVNTLKTGIPSFVSENIPNGVVIVDSDEKSQTIDPGALEAFTKERSTLGNDNQSLERGLDFITKESKSSTLGPDALERVGEIITNAVIRDESDLGSGRSTFGPDAQPVDVLSIKSERSTFGQDTVVKERVTIEPGRATFGPDAVIKDGVTIEPGRATFGQDTVLKDKVTEKPGRATFGQDSVIRDKVTMEPGRATFGQDAVVKDKVTEEPGRSTFGQDAVISDMVTMEPGRSTFGPDAVVKDKVTQEPGRATFGHDAVISDIVTKEPERATLGQDTIISDSVTMEPNRDKFGQDAVLKDKVTIEPGSATFGQDAIFNDSVIMAPGRATFGPDGVIRDWETMAPGRATFGPDVVIRDRETMAPGRATFGPDAIMIDKMTTKPGRSTFGPEKVVSDRVTMEPGHASFGLDTVVGDGANMERGRATFGMDAMVRDGVTIKPARATFGPDSIGRDGDTMDQGHSMFGPDQVEGADMTTGHGNATFGTDMIDSEGSTLGPKRMIFGADPVIRNGMTSGLGRATFGPDTMIGDGMANDPRGTSFGRDSIVNDGMTIGTSRVTFNPDAIVADGETAGPSRATFGSDVLLGDRVSIIPERATFGHDTLSKDRPFLGSSSVSDIKVSNQSLLNSIQLNEVKDPSIIRDNINSATEETHFGNDFLTRKIFTGGPEVATEQTSAFVNEGIDESRTTLSSIIRSVTTDAPFTRVVFGEFIERRKLFTSTIGPSVEPPIMPLDFVNAFNSESATSIDSKVNSTRLETSVDTQNAIDNQIMLNEDSIMSTMSNAMNDPIVEETISKKSETSLLNSVRSVSQNLPGSLFDQIMDTVSELSPNSSIRGSVLSDELQGMTTFDSEPTTVDTLQDNSTSAPVTVREMTTLVSESTTNDRFAESSTGIPLSSQDTTITSEIQASTLSIEAMESTTQVTSADIVNNAIEGKTILQNDSMLSTLEPGSGIIITVTEGTNENIGTTIVPPETTTPDTQDSTTERFTINTSPTEILLTTSTLPPIIPADREIMPLDIQREEVASVIKSIPSTQRPQRTTKRPYNVMNDMPVLVNDRTVIDSGGVPKTDKDQLNVSLEDEPNKSLFDMNNKTYIIVVIAIAGFIILVAIAAVIIRNRRKSNAAKSEINNGVSASNHNNAAFDASEAERGNVAPSTNGVESSKPAVEVIEPNGDS